MMIRNALIFFKLISDRLVTIKNDIKSSIDIKNHDRVLVKIQLKINTTYGKERKRIRHPEQFQIERKVQPPNHINKTIYRTCEEKALSSLIKPAEIISNKANPAVMYAIKYMIESIVFQMDRSIPAKMNTHVSQTIGPVAPSASQDRKSFISYAIKAHVREVAWRTQNDMLPDIESRRYPPLIPARIPAPMTANIPLPCRA